MPQALARRSARSRCRWPTVGGTGNAIVLTYAPTPGAYVSGSRFEFVATASNTGPTTVSINALGGINVFKRSSAGVVACTGGEIRAGDVVILDCDGAQMQIVSPIGSKQPTRTVLTS